MVSPINFHSNMMWELLTKMDPQTSEDSEEDNPLDRYANEFNNVIREWQNEWLEEILPSKKKERGDWDE